MDQKTVRAKIDEKVLNDRVILYPGADELGMVLVSRAINALENNTPPHTSSMRLRWRRS